MWYHGLHSWTKQNWDETYNSNMSQKKKKKKKKIMDFHYVIHEKFNFDFEIGVSVGYLRINKP